jgi:hypothetical protein
LRIPYNKVESESTGYSPFYLAFGRVPISFPEELDLLESDDLNWLEELQDTIKEVRLNLQDSRTIQKKYADEQRHDAPKYTKDQLILLVAEGISWPDKPPKPARILEDHSE